MSTSPSPGSARVTSLSSNACCEVPFLVNTCACVIIPFLQLQLQSPLSVHGFHNASDRPCTFPACTPRTVLRSPVLHTPFVPPQKIRLSALSISPGGGATHTAPPCVLPVPTPATVSGAPFYGAE